MEDQIRKILLEIKPDLDTDCQELISLGELDSFDVVMLVQELEETFNIKIPVSKVLLENFESVENIAKLIDSIKSGSY